MCALALASHKVGHFVVLGTLSLPGSQSRFWLLFRAIVWHPDCGHIILQCEEST